MANQLKGEIEIDFDGKKLVLRPTFEGLLEMEDKAGLSISAILQKFVKSDWSFRMISAVIYGGLFHYVDPRSGERTYPYDQVGSIIISTGMKKFMLPALKLISTSLNPAREDGEDAPEKKEPNAQAT